MSLTEGFRHCYLLNETGSAQTGGASATFAEIVAAREVSETGSSDEDGGSSSSKVWIAGAVIGAVAAVAGGLFGALWGRRRRRSRQAQYDPTPTAGELEAPGKAHIPSKPQEKDGRPTVRHELRDPNSERLWPPEMRGDRVPRECDWVGCCDQSSNGFDILCSNGLSLTAVRRICASLDATLSAVVHVSNVVGGSVRVE